MDRSCSYSPILETATEQRPRDKIGWKLGGKGDTQRMGHSQGRTNAKKRAARRKKTERLALAKSKQAGKNAK
jgi:hypothetical protein